MGMNEELNIRAMREEDCETIAEAFKLQNCNKPVEQYRG